MNGSDDYQTEQRSCHPRRPRELRPLWAREPRQPSPSVTDEDRTCPREMTRGPSDGLAPGVVGGRAVDRRHLASHRAEVRADLAAMMDRVEEEPPGHLGDGVFPSRADRHHEAGPLLPPSILESRAPVQDVVVHE